MSSSTPSARATPNFETWILIATILPSSMGFISTSGLDAASPAMQSDLGITGSTLFWIINIYALFLSALILVGGSLGDHYGRKRVFMFGIGIFTAASLACGFAPDANSLIFLRAVQGIGAALMIPGSLSIITAVFPSDKRGKAIGTWATFSAITSVLGAPLGGWLAGQGLWRAVFFVNIPFGLIALVVLASKVPESKDENAPKQLDYAGALLATLALGGLTYGFLQAPTYGFADVRILLALGIGVAAFVGFGFVESRSDHPMVPLRLFKSRTFSGTNALTLFLYAALRVVPFFLVLNLVQVQEYPQEVAGFSLLPFGLLLAVMGRWSGGLVDRVGPRLPLIAGPAISGSGFFMMALPGITGGASDYWTTYFPGVLVLGIGMGITVAPLTTAVMGSAPQSQSGTASGINNAVSRTAGVLAVAILGSVTLFFFNGALDRQTADLNLSPEIRAELDDEASKLAEASPPAGLDDETTQQVQRAIDQSFVDTFRLVALIGAALAWLSAVMAWLLVDKQLFEN